MKKLLTFLACLFFLAFAGCQSRGDEKVGFTEIRLHRWTALEGGETFILRRVGNGWTGKLIGDGNRFGCFYDRSLEPKAGDWKQVYDSLLQAGILELSGKEPDLGWEDGNGYDLEVTDKGHVTQYSVILADKQKSSSAKRILKIGRVISNAIDSPMFDPEYDRGAVAEYLINNCKDLRKEVK